MALAIGDRRSVEISLAERARVADALRKLERALDILPCSLVIAVMSPAARAPGQDARAEQIAWEPDRSARTRASLKRPSAVWTLDR